MKKSTPPILIISICCIIAACDHNRIYESYNTLPIEGWQVDSVFSYTFPIKDSAQHYNLYFNMRNTVDYPFSNIWLFVSIEPPQGKVLTDTIEFILADPMGKWLGQGHGKFRDNKLLFRQNVFFPDTGKYIFNVQQGMREDFLKGINDFGIRVEKAN